MKRTYRYERGASPVVMIIVVLVIAIVIFAGAQIGMLQLAYMNVKEKTKAEMMYALVPPFEDVDTKVRNKIVELLNEIKAEYKEEHIKIEVSDNNTRMHVEIWYSKSHNLPLYQNPKQFYITLDHTAPST
jgi:hypothetical protein